MSVVSVPERMRISADRYEKMVATGVLTKYDRIELIDGDMINMAPIGLNHAAVIARLNRLFVLSAGDSAIVSPGGSVKLSDYSVPQPNLMLLQPRADYYATRIPMAPDVMLLVEISESSLAFDQGAKRALYARHGVAEYWVVDIPGKRVHVYREPMMNGYGEAFERTLTATVSPRALPAIQVTVGTLFA
ncbi:MAG TPA: Uma2 family endonuclease [Steroidobacteraceae bacterium]